MEPETGIINEAISLANNTAAEAEGKDKHEGGQSNIK